MNTTKNTTWKLKLRSISNIQNEVKSIFRSAKKEHLPHSTVLKMLKDRVYTQSKYTTLPNYMRSEIDGYINANFDLMYELVEWVHWYDGKFVGKELPYGEGFQQNLINDSKHVYIGTENPYS